ncbi:MAG: YceI family protein [Parvularculaceae bacterium]
MRRVSIWIIAALALAGCASIIAPKPTADLAALKSGAYKLDKRHAAVLFRIDHLGFSDYVGRFETLDAALDFDPEDPSSARIEAIVDIASLDVADDDFAETLRGDGWFDAASFPQAAFRSTAVEAISSGDGATRADVVGELTLKGITRPMTLEATFNGGDRDVLRGNAYVVGFSAVGAFDRTEFGLDKFAGPIGETVRLEIEAEFIRE